MKLIKITIFSMLVVLAACGGKKIITTTDDSADYHSAVALPPLKKNIPPSNTAASSATSINTGQQGEPLQANLSGIGASILDVSNTIKRARIDAPIDNAWVYLLDRLKSSAVTIHSRNWSAARIEVGCGTINDGVSEDTESGWSFFNREKILYEYCVLQLDERSDTTTVSVVNRRGEEVSGVEAMTLLGKIVP